MPTLREEMETQRARYMAREITHAEYYLWLADRIGLTTETVCRKIGKEDILASTDPHLNDIPLSRWDAQHQTVLSYARSRAGGSFAWSLCDSVCCMKALARKVREEANRT